ncbi:GntR family transcriptional regulator [Leucobacter luti]|uniref:GntR family transcriptional regulator n=1 Tax=Leucobacter luti TaxID=340320 RepID=UPI0010478B2A|nr:GntR family transcriptional regulator [Leucobacter luti]MCW2289742.1 GntR family transcriptional regulator [Leucobacter luti]TCK34278.1 GntR family transcriptional regulator [Leucobacter luti]
MARPGSRVALVADGLRDAIRSEEFCEGARLPTEAQIATRFGVSRPTVRAALRELETIALVHTQHGVGTFVTERPAITAGLERLDSITESIRSTGREPGMVYKGRVIRPLLPDEAEKLGLSGDAHALELRRTILADGEVVAYSYDLMPLGVFPEGADPEMVDGSLFSYLRDDRDLHPHYAVAEVHAVQSDGIGWDVAGGGRTALYVLLDQVHFERSGRPLLYSRTYFLEGRYAFTIRRAG